MKMRNGFVSNSSSTAFILDRRKLDADTLYKVSSLPDMGDLDRCTGACFDAQDFVNRRQRWYNDDWDDRFGAWIQNWINTIGNENVILCRESDEGMGGMFKDVGLAYCQICNLAESEMEYH